MVNFETLKIGQYVYSSLHGANVCVLGMYEEDGFNGKRVVTAGLDAPHWEYLSAKPNQETHLYTRAENGRGYIHTGILGKQGEPWALTEFDDE